MTLTAKVRHRSPSELIGILDPVVALDFDHCAAMRLLQWEREQRAAELKAIYGDADNADTRSLMPHYPPR